jgi:hypothetical protein
VLGGMLLHMIAAAGGIDLAVDAGSGLHVLEWGIEVMDDLTVFGIGDFGDVESGGRVAGEF